MAKDIKKSPKKQLDIKCSNCFDTGQEYNGITFITCTKCKGDFENFNDPNIINLEDDEEEISITPRVEEPLNLNTKFTHTNNPTKPHSLIDSETEIRDCMGRTVDEIYD